MMKPGKKKDKSADDVSIDNKGNGRESESDFTDRSEGFGKVNDLPDSFLNSRSGQEKKLLDFRESILLRAETEHVNELRNILGALPRYSFRLDRLFPKLKVNSNTREYTLISELSPIAITPGKRAESIEHIRKIESCLKKEILSHNDFALAEISLSINLDPDSRVMPKTTLHLYGTYKVFCAKSRSASREEKDGTVGWRTDSN